MSDRTTSDRAVVKEFYDNGSEIEWKRIEGRPEFLLTCRYLDRYIKPGMRILDIGGGPGRYSIYYAKRGCDVTLYDLSDGNVSLARKLAAENAVQIRGIQGDACEIDTILSDEKAEYDAVLLMGPLYHLLKEDERIRAVDAALTLLKPGGIFAASFITMFASIIYYMKECPEMLGQPIPAEIEFMRLFSDGKSYSGEAFTRAHFAALDSIEPFMAQFPLEKITMISQEGILSPCEEKIFACSPEVIEKWLDIAELLADKPEYLTWAEHILYIGRKEI